MGQQASEAFRNAQDLYKKQQQKTTFVEYDVNMEREPYPANSPGINFSNNF